MQFPHVPQSRRLRNSGEQMSITKIGLPILKVKNLTFRDTRNLGKITLFV